MPVKVEKTYDLPCYVCAKVFVCSRWEVTTVIDPPQPLCKGCRAAFVPGPGPGLEYLKSDLTRYFGSNGGIPGWNKELKAFITAVESCRVRPKYMDRFQVRAQAWIQIPAGRQHPKHCLCGLCESDKTQLAKPPSPDLLELVERVDRAVLSTYFPEV